MKLRRKISQYQGGDPAAMCKMSEGAIFYAFDDAKHDILALHEQNAALVAALKVALPYADSITKANAEAVRAAIAELEFQRDDMTARQRLATNMQIGLIQEIKHDYETAKNEDGSV